MNEKELNQDLAKYIHNISKKDLEEIVWNFVLLRADENYIEAKKLLKEELRLIRRNK